MSNQVIEKHNSSVGKKVNVKQIWLYCAEGKSEEKSLSISDIGTDNSQNIWQLANNVSNSQYGESIENESDRKTINKHREYP